MKIYHVEIAVGNLTGAVVVKAETPEDAKGEAEELIKAQPVEAIRAWELDET